MRDGINRHAPTLEFRNRRPGASAMHRTASTGNALKPQYEPADRSWKKAKTAQRSE